MSSQAFIFSDWSLLFFTEVQTTWRRHRICTGAKLAPVHRWGSWARAGPSGREEPFPDWERPWLCGTCTYLPNEGTPGIYISWSVHLVLTCAMLSITSLSKFCHAVVSVCASLFTYTSFRFYNGFPFLHYYKRKPDNHSTATAFVHSAGFFFATIDQNG